MPDKTLSKVPKYRLYKPRGLGLVRISGRDFYLGKYGTPESLEAYQRIVTEWLANHGQVSHAGSKTGSHALTVDGLFVAYWSFVKGYYVKNGCPTGEQQNIRDAYRPLKGLYGSAPANEFEARSLKAVRQKMIDDGLSHGVVNARVNRIRRMFKWAVENELVDPDTLHALQAVASLKRGRSSARETSGGSRGRLPLGDTALTSRERHQEMANFKRRPRQALRNSDQVKAPYYAAAGWRRSCDQPCWHVAVPDRGTRPARRHILKKYGKDNLLLVRGSTEFDPKGVDGCAS